MLKFLNKDKNKEVKEFILKEYFNSREQKKAIMKAARESAEDQRLLISRYNSLVNQEEFLLKYPESAYKGLNSTRRTT